MNHFICLEGVDGVGKTEVGKLLAQKLGYIYYKSPGGPFALARTMVDIDIDPLTRYFFYRAAVQHDSRMIGILLNKSGVVCDRYIYSTHAFHAAMDSHIGGLFELTNLVMPEYVFVLTAREGVRLERLKNRSDAIALDFNQPVQEKADRIFRGFGHPMVDTSDNTVEQTVEYILANYLKGGNL